MTTDDIEDLLNEDLDLEAVEGEETELYEHFRVVADRGQELASDR